ncbi:hypothetical protein KSS87_005888 [Heliosperma pusillum]|nr:hypothetical protein KSS87_005888 [Heliosperma pusillum]
MKPTKRNDEPSTSVHDEATEDSAAEEVVVNNEENPSAKQAPAPSLSQTQPALRDTDYHTFIDGLVARSYEKEKAKRGLPTFDIWTAMLKIQYKELNKKYGGCFDRDLLSDNDLECADEENDDKFDVTNLNSDDGGEAEKRNDEEECFDDFVTNIVLGVTSNIEHMYEDTNVDNKKDDVESNVPDEGNQNKDFDDGKPDDSNISTQRCIKKMIDIDHDDEDDGEMKKYKAEVFSTWDTWSGIYDEPLNLNAEMVFVPLLYEQHYFCVCIDFVREKLFYLDNRCYDDFNETTFAYMTDVVKRDLYRGEVAATLILSDFNGNRSEVLERVTRHNEMKGNLLPKLLSKRERIKKKKIKGRAGVKNVQTPDSKIKDMVEDGSASVVGSSRRGKSDGLGCTFKCGMADDKEGKGDENKEQNLKKIFDTWDEFVSKNTVPCNWKADLIFVPMASHMSDYLEGKGDERALELVGFPVVHIKFNWQTYEENHIESVNFLMMHMIRYEGDIFWVDLKSKVYRRYYWAKMAAALLLADINKERANLIDRVKEFSATKDKIWKEVKPKRGKTGTIKEKKGVAEEEGGKVDSLTKEKEDTIEMTRINTEIPVLHNPPRQYHTVQGDIDDGQSKRVFKRYKRPAHSRGTGRGRERNCSQ